MDNKQEERKRCDVVQLNPATSGSVSSSPSHEFSFTISLGTTTMETPMKIAEKNNNNKKHSSFAIDLSPADEIFFHGHLLPLHLLSHVPVSPRSSINSLDSFTLPIHELSEYNNNDDDDDNNNSNNISSTTNDDQFTNTDHHKNISHLEEKGRRKLKFFSFLGLPRWRKSKETEGESEKSKFNIRQVVKRYMRLVKPFLAMINRRRNDQRPRRQPYSFSGNLMMRSKEFRGRREEYSSAPASMMTSRTNSGLLAASGSVTPTKSDSTMEELQAAIQAAIAHCKNTLASDHQINLS